jgi:hypothetical protein
MALPIESFEHFLKQQADHDEPCVASIILYSARQSQEEIGAFIANQRNFFDELAQRADAWIYFFDCTTSNDSAANPSGEIARLFDIPIDELPGVLVYSAATESDGASVFFPIRTETFIEQPEVAEQRLADLHKLICEARERCGASAKPQEIVAALQQRATAWRKQEGRRPFWDLLRDNARPLRLLPSTFVSTFFDTLARSLGNVGRT